MLALALCLLLAPSPQDVTDAAAASAFKRLPPEEQLEVLSWWEAECQNRQSFVRSLEKHVLYEVSDQVAPRPPRPMRWYDAAKQAPAQVIPRRPLSEGSKALERERGRLGVPGPDALPVISFDWATGDLIVRASSPSPMKRFEGALSGRSPDHDRVLALVERALARSEVREVHAAFSHGYATRTGEAFPGISLYDAWASGEELEMPDVECLGLYRDLGGSWERFTAPVPGNQQAPLYKAIGDHFRRAWRERSVVEGLASCYLDPEAELDPAFASSRDRLELLWESVSSRPADLRKKLPPLDPDAWKAWWESLDALRKQDGLAERSAGRRMALRADRTLVRGRLIWILQQWGAL